MWLSAKVISRPSGVTRRSAKSAPALLISTSMRGSLAAIAAPTRRVSAMLERSARCTRWPSPGAFASSLQHRRLRATLVARDEHDARAQPGKLQDRDFADAGRRAGRDDGLAFHQDGPLAARPTTLCHLSACRRRKKRDAPISRGRERAPEGARRDFDRDGLARYGQEHGRATAGGPMNGQGPARFDARRLARSAEAFDRAVADYYGLTGDPVGILKQALARDPNFALGGVAIAALYHDRRLSRRPSQRWSARLRAAEAAIRRASARERRHLAAAKAWAEGETCAAILGWETILADHPTDALALRLAQDAYLLSRPIARDPRFAWRGSCRPGNATIRSRASSSASTPSGSRRRANSSAPRTSAARPWPRTRATPGRRMRSLTSWRPRTATRRASPFSSRPASDWSPAHFMAGHNGWHLALFLIEQGRFDEVLADYDRFSAPKLADDATLDRVDAAALLWRLELAGVDVGDRWAPVADAVDGACRRPRARLQRSALRLRRRALARPGRRRAVPPVARRLRAPWARATIGR